MSASRVGGKQEMRVGCCHRRPGRNRPATDWNFRKNCMDALARGIVFALIVLAPSQILAGSASDWARVAKTQGKHAKSLAEESVRLDSGFYARAKAYVRSCELTLIAPDKERGLGRLEWHQLYLYAKGICRPWLERWHEELKPCEPDDAPDWCLDDQAALRRLDPLLTSYFESLLSEMQAAPDALTRYNLLSFVIRSIDTNPMENLPAKRIVEWMDPSIREFLHSASGQDAIDLAQGLRDSWIGLDGGMRDRFSEYTTASKDISPLHRQQLLDLINQSTDDSHD